jgi:hypothetical protein
MRGLGSGFSIVCAVVLLIGAGCGGNDELTHDDLREQPDAATGAASDRLDSLKVGLAERSGSGQYGVATLTRIGDESSELVLELFDGPARLQAAAVREGTCDSPGKIVFELNDLEHGRSATRIGGGLPDLIRKDLVIVVRETTDRESEVSVCSELDARRSPDVPSPAAAADGVRLGKELCRRLDTGSLTRVFGGSPDDLEAIARELASTLRPELRPGAVDGCLAALRAQA